MKIEFLDPIIPKPDDSGRSPGLHVSGLIHHIMRTGKMRQYKLAAEVSGEDWKRAYNRWEAGFTYEAVMTREYAKRRAAEAGAKCETQIEVERDKVFGTIDLFDLGLWMVVEFKWTQLSSRRWQDVDALRRLRAPVLPKWMWAWDAQIKAYCHMMDSEMAELHVMFGAGDYRGGGPVPKRIRLYFTKEELSRNWSMLLARAGEVKKSKERWVLA